jgi:hypothetical protein
VCLLHFRIGEARHQITLCHKAAIHRETVTAGAVELLRAKAQPDRGFGAALGAHHSGGATAGAVPKRPRLDEHDVGRAAFGEQHGRPRADRATPHNHDISVARAGHTTER